MILTFSVVFLSMKKDFKTFYGYGNDFELKKRTLTDATIGARSTRLLRF